MALQTAIVTGAGDGLGSALVTKLLDADFAVAFCGRNEAKLETLRRRLPYDDESVYYEAFDVRNNRAVSEFVARVHSRFQRIDVLVNNAGVMYLAPVLETESDDLIEMIDVNLKASMQFILQTLPILRAQRCGDILNISSISAKILGPGVAGYSSTKLALDNFTEGLRRELAGSGIRTMSLNLGAVQTGLNDKIKHDGMRKIIKMREKTYTAMKPDEVAEMILFMLSRRRNVCLANAFMVPSDQSQ